MIEKDLELSKFRAFIKVAKSTYDMDYDHALDYYLTCYSRFSNYDEETFIRLSEWFVMANNGENRVVIRKKDCNFGFESIENRLFENVHFLSRNNLLPELIRDSFLLNDYVFDPNDHCGKSQIVALPLNQPNKKQLSLISENIFSIVKSISPSIPLLIRDEDIKEAFTYHAEILAAFRREELNNAIQVNAQAHAKKLRI